MLENLSLFGRRFRRDECGAVTVDWVVLTAALIGLSIAILTSVSQGATELSDDVKRCMRITGNQVLRDQSTDSRSWEWRMARAQRNCGRL